MKKTILNLGRALHTVEQKNVKGGQMQIGIVDRDGRDCRYPYCLNNFGRCVHSIHGCSSGAGGNDGDITTFF
ncbi:hypothetical protein [uncultured Tenacibaculum sp.]|uniref:hypothetical protein n=1 Tax=uncultured Tenacibaculum sp. TaxID=174713 RepID=UPI0026296303|nr:hypothetical protein [uncultured Tenacibaculum sp.]